VTQLKYSRSGIW